MTHPSDLRGPRAVQVWNNIALIVSKGARPLKEARRYVEALPATSHIFLHADNTAAQEVIGIACERRLAVTRVPDAHDTVRLATIAVVFGECPFDDRDIEILNEQGIPVEYDMSRRKRGGGPRGRARS